MWKINKLKCSTFRVLVYNKMQVRVHKMLIVIGDAVVVIQ